VEPVIEKGSHSITAMYSAHNDPNSGINENGSDLSLNSLDINCSKDRVAVGGNQCKVHIYDD
jgi:hypothetical protein